jgi:hypothetical protein
LCVLAAVPSRWVCELAVIAFVLVLGSTFALLTDLHPPGFVVCRW